MAIGNAFHGAVIFAWLYPAIDDRRLELLDQWRRNTIKMALLFLHSKGKDNAVVQRGCICPHSGPGSDSRGRSGDRENAALSIACPSFS
jgi:hypothetical protein